MKLQTLTIIFIIIILPIILVLSSYIGYELQTINLQNQYNTGLVSATHDAILAYELNSKNDNLSQNAEKKRENVKASIKTFENSFSNSCNLGLYNNTAIEEYIPAIAFCFYDGLYLYTPSQTQGGYKHNLRNYVYYSETIEGTDIVINYTLDNYVAVSGTINGTYQTKAGYLIDLMNCSEYRKSYYKPDLPSNFKYRNGVINQEEQLTIYKYDENQNKAVRNTEEEQKEKNYAINYYTEAVGFTLWFDEEICKKESVPDYLEINRGSAAYNQGTQNDPEDENSEFSKHKKEVIKKKIEETLNSSITAYSKKINKTYKMPKFSEEDWEKIYNNISVISFVQGMKMGFKEYNNYCILNSTNNQEYVNPNLIYFSDGNEYHTVRCENIASTEKDIVGYKASDFEKQTHETQDGQKKYYYLHNEQACYDCINSSQLGDDNQFKLWVIVNGKIIKKYATPYEYVEDRRISYRESRQKQRDAYFTALARERYKTIKLLSNYNVK